MKNFEMVDLIISHSVKLNFVLAKYMVNDIVNQLEILVVFNMGKNKSYEILQKKYTELINREIISYKDLADRIIKLNS